MAIDNTFVSSRLIIMYQYLKGKVVLNYILCQHVQYKLRICIMLSIEGNPRCFACLGSKWVLIVNLYAFTRLCFSFKCIVWVCKMVNQYLIVISIYLIWNIGHSQVCLQFKGEWGNTWSRFSTGNCMENHDVLGWIFPFVSRYMKKIKNSINTRMSFEITTF